MNFQETLDDFKRKVNIELEAFFNKTIKDTTQKDEFIADSLRYVKKLTLSGGKRLRAALMYYGYLACGGKEEKEMIKTSVSIELIHIFLLIHDDIIDRDLKRHGVDTIHHTYEKIGKKIFSQSDNEHFGKSMAIIIGDMIGALGNQIIFNSSFNPELVVKALSKLQSIVSLTVIGQSQDLYIEYKRKATEKEILKMYENKTAKYTIEGPLQLGAILGRASDETLKKIGNYAIPIGIAFQIQDDILGIFGSEEKMGKSVGADIKEGKQTILLSKAGEKANKEQKKNLERIFGNQSITKKEVGEFRKIIIETGSLEYAKNLSTELISGGKRELEKLEIKGEAKNFLLGMADYMMSREV
ncbi:MAG: polyprenyl synthetase family protein [bacterium]|nr:polyprenyl synthetase family protein [bacterium]